MEEMQNITTYCGKTSFVFNSLVGAKTDFIRLESKKKNKKKRVSEKNKIPPCNTRTARINRNGIAVCCEKSLFKKALLTCAKLLIIEPITNAI